MYYRSSPKENPRVVLPHNEDLTYRMHHDARYTVNSVEKDKWINKPIIGGPNLTSGSARMCARVKG